VSENETTQPRADAEIPGAQLSEAGLEQVAGGTYIPCVGEWIEQKVAEIAVAIVD
jgi:hypothetical protein